MAKQNRYALLLGSNKKLDESMSDISFSVVKNNIDAMAKALSSLGKYNFIWPGNKSSEPKQMINASRGKVMDTLETLGNKYTPKNNDLFLLYYYGHGFAANDKLALGFGKLNDQKFESYTLNSIINEIASAGFKKMIFIIDCCHAGLTDQTIPLQLPHEKFLLITSTTRGYDYIDNEFTLSLADQLKFPRTPNLRVAGIDKITFQSWFDIAKEDYARKNNSKLTDTPLISGGLGNEILTDFEIEVQPNVRHCRQTSIYSRLYVLLNLLFNGPLDIKKICNKIRQKNLDGFRFVSYRNGPHIEFLKKATIQNYLFLAANIGLIKQINEKWVLTTAGVQAISNDGANYNKKLVNGILKFIEPYGLKKEVIKPMLHKMVTDDYKLPNIINIEGEMASNKDFCVMPRKHLKIVFKLLHYAGFIQRATPDTFFAC